MAGGSATFFDEDDDDFRGENFWNRQNLQSDSDYSIEEDLPSSDEFENDSELESLQLHRQRRNGTWTNTVGAGSSRRTSVRTSTAQVSHKHRQFAIVHFRSPRK